MVEEPLEEIIRLGFEEPLGRSCSIGTPDEVVVDHGQGSEFLGAETMKAVMAKGKLTITTLYTGTGPLE